MNYLFEQLGVESELVPVHDTDFKERKANISATGIAFACKEKYVPGDLLHINVIFEDINTQIRVIGKVLQCDAPAPYTESDNMAYFVRVRFVKIAPREQIRIAQYVLEKQNKLFIGNINTQINAAND
jgi:hypothetical protein